MTVRHLRLAGAALLAVYGLVCLRTSASRGLLDGVDLAIHETGHLVFLPFSEVVTALGAGVAVYVLSLVLAVRYAAPAAPVQPAEELA